MRRKKTKTGLRDELAELRVRGRREAGDWLQRIREKVGLTQRDVALAVGFAHDRTVRQVELGKAPISSRRYEAWARVLRVDPFEFTCTLKRLYDPWHFRVAFGSRHADT